MTATETLNRRTHSVQTSPLANNCGHLLVSNRSGCYDNPKWNKPIFLISGNHENYQNVYGISPLLITKGGMRLNKGAPADHNLTIYEACLMYGPEYWWCNLSNFTPAYADWFYRVLTPFTDYRITYKTQSIVALGWGDKESIANLSVMGSDTTLFRASESVSDTQLELLNAAAEKDGQRLLCTHYPFASYDVSHCLGAEGKINCNNLLKEFDHFSQGTFKKNRVDVYRLLAKNKFHFTLSGHSHRSGMYAGSFQDGGRPTYTVTGNEIPLEAKPFAAKDQCNMVVSGCSGPIGVQNHYGTIKKDIKTGEIINQGLGGWGLDYPSGNHLTLDRGKETIKRIIPNIKNVPSAQPRFAVALDYLDILGREEDKGHQGVFTSIVSDATGACFTFTVNEDLPKECFIDQKINIVAYMGDKPNVGKVYSMDVTCKGGGVYEAVLSGKNKRVIAEKIIAQQPPAQTFLHITFTKALANLPGYTQYNYDSPWIYPIEIVERKTEERERLERLNTPIYEIERRVGMVNGYELRRPQKYGEVPDFKWYNNTFKYGFPRTIT